MSDTAGVNMCDHFYATHSYKGMYVRLCTLCREPDWVDLALQRKGFNRTVRDILEAICVRDGISLASEANAEEPARNYELALRLRIGHVFGIPND